MANVLVLANETIGGEALLDAIRERHEQGDARFFVVVPQTRPRHGNVIYDEAVRDSAQVRVDLALAFMREEGIEGAGEVGDGDPFNAAMDAIGERGISEVIVSTLPTQASGWLRRDLIQTLRRRDRACRSSTSSSTSTPRACRSTSRSWSPTRPSRAGELVEHLKELAGRGPAALHRRRPAGPRRRPRGRARRASGSSSCSPRSRTRGSWPPA